MTRKVTSLLGLHTVLAVESTLFAQWSTAFKTWPIDICCLSHFDLIGAGDYYNASLGSDELSSQGLPHAFMLRHMQDQPLGEISSWRAACGYTYVQALRLLWPPVQCFEVMIAA